MRATSDSNLCSTAPSTTRGRSSDISSAKLVIPPSTSTVEVKAINAAEVDLPASLFLHPVLPGHEILNGICYSFLIENHSKGQRVIFDLGIRKDVENYPPTLAARVQHFVIRVEKDVATQLKEGGVDLEDINAIIWSHSHFDHTGNTATFPTSTELIIGPGTKENFFPPYPENPEGLFLETEFKDRKVTEVSFEESVLSFGGFKALDFFGDGSFYLLDVPGHIPGHMAALARATPDTFILLGADTCHHPGQLRPSPNLNHTFPCPGALLSAPISKSHFFHDGESTNLSDRTRPLLTIPPAGVPSVHSDPVQAEASIGKLAEYFDSHPDIFVVIAHDTSLGNIVELFPENMNAWKEKGWKDRGTWAFLEEGNPAFIFNARSAA